MNLIDKVKYTVIKQEDYYLADCREFDIWAVGDTEKEAKENLNFALNRLYENYALEDDDKLSPKAIKLKKKLIKKFRKKWVVSINDYN